MEIKLGAHIAALRKSNGMTQEQLALAVGVSPPAVSKWETDSSCPDIALLCPLARALNTNVDTLLLFEDTLSEEQLAVHINEIIELARNKECGSAERMLQKLLHTYPSSTPLKFNAIGVLDMFAMVFPSENSEKLDDWKKQKKKLLEEIYYNGSSAYWQNAVSGLALIAIQEDNLKQAEQFLRELPEHAVDTTMLWTQLYLKRDETEKALEIAQKRLYTLACQMQICLTSMMNEKFEPDADKMLEICEVYRKLEEIFGIGGGLSAGFFVEAYQRMGQSKKAMDSLIQMIDVITSPMQMPNPLLFSSAVKAEKEKPVVVKEMKEMILHGLLTDGSYAPFREDVNFLSAVEKLRFSIHTK